MTSEPRPEPNTVTTKRSARMATLLLLAVTVFWGATFVLNQNVLARVTAADLQTWRFGAATVMMVALRPHWLLAAPREHIRHGFWLGLVLGAGYLVQLLGLTRTTATASGFITGMFVVFVPLLAAAIFRQRVPAAAWAGVAMSFAGLALIALNGLAIGFGEVLTLLCAILFALHIIGLDKWADPDYVYSITTTQIATVFIASLVVSLGQGGPVVPRDATTWFTILLLAAVGTCIGFFAQTWVQSQLSSTRAAVIMTMEPVFAGLAGITVGSDALTPRIVVGSLLILGATYVVELGPRHSAEGSHIHLEP